jgi:Lrp/AsnC family leucine-responsive transcriptional regulator
MPTLDTSDTRILAALGCGIRALVAVVSQMCLLAETSASIILKSLREDQVMLPPQRGAAA